MRRGSRARDAVGTRGLEIGGGGDTREIGGPSARHGGPLVRATRSHLDDRAPACCADHAGSGGRYGAVVVEDREDQRLEHHCLGEGSAHREDRRVREVQLTLAIPVDIAGELVVTEPLDGLVVEEAFDDGDLVFAEAELCQRVEDASGACDDPVPAAVGEPACEHLEHTLPVCDRLPQRGGDHGELVLVREQGGVADGHDPLP